MALQIIYGTAGTGKSTYIYEQIKKQLQIENFNESQIQTKQYPIKIITPEQFSFTAEKKLLEISPQDSVLQAEVITFNRMAFRILQEVGGKTKKHLSKSGKAMLLNNILLTQKNDFTFLGKTDENVKMLARQLTELKKHAISLENLKQVTQNTQDIYLKRKLEDITKIYESYTSKIQNQYLDENDGLTILSQKLEDSKEFTNCNIYLDEFAGFTLQEYEILRKLLRLSHQVTITICADNLNFDTNPDIDIFYANKQTAKRLLKIAKEEKIEINQPIQLELVDKENENINNRIHKEWKPIKRFHTPELKHLAENIELPFYQKYENKVKNLSLFLANNPYSEIEQVAIQITKLVKNQNYHYKDIAVITKDLSTYASLCKVIFKQYQIPVFMDEKKDLSQNVVIQFIFSLLDIFAKNWSYEAVVGYLKTGFTNLEPQEISMVENYSLKWGLKGSKWYQKDWNFYDETEEQKQLLNYAKQQFIEPLLKLKQELKGYKTVEQITKGIYQFLLENEIPEKLEEKIAELEKIGELELANQYNSSWKMIIELLEEMVSVLGEEQITFERYSKILKMGFESSDLGTIPGTADQVIVGDTERSRSHKVKAVFIIGLNDGSFPSNHKEEGFLDDKDRETLKEQGIELAKGTMEQLYDDHFNIYKAFTTAEEKLYLSYLSSDSEGKSLRPSILVNKVKRIFPELKEQSDVVERKSEILLENTTFDELLIHLRKFAEGEKIDAIWFSLYRYYQTYEPDKLAKSLKALQYKNTPEKIEQDKMNQLYGNTLKTSVSRLEQYQSCPFSYYLKYGLKVKEQNTFQVEAIDTGNFMHDVIDTFFTRIEEQELNIKDLTEEQINNITNEIVAEKLTLKRYDIFQSIPKYRVLAQRLKKVIQKSMIYIVNSLKYSEFEVLGHEVEFKEQKQYPPITFTLKDGKKVEITGKIDRIDIAKMADGNYIRIIDYKSSVKNINLNEVVAGLQLQLLTYLDAACKVEDMLPAGVFYFPLIDPLLNTDTQMEEEQIKQELQKQFKMKGLILADAQIVKKMDTTLQSGNSNLVPAYLNKEGEISEKPSTLNRKQFEYLQNYMEKTIKQISEEILGGKIAIEPYYQVQTKKTPCEYCEYKAICNFNQVTKNDYRYIANQNKEAIMEKIKNN